MMSSSAGQVSVVRTAHALVIEGQLPAERSGYRSPRSGLTFTLTLHSVRDVQELVTEMREPDPDRQEAWPLVGALRVEGDPLCMPALVASRPIDPWEPAEAADAGVDHERTLIAYCNCGVSSVLFRGAPAVWDALCDAVASASLAGLPDDVDLDIDWRSVRRHQHFGVPRPDYREMTEAPF